MDKKWFLCNQSHFLALVMIRHRTVGGNPDVPHFRRAIPAAKLNVTLKITGEIWFVLMVGHFLFISGK